MTRHDTVRRWAREEHVPDREQVAAVLDLYFGTTEVHGLTDFKDGVVIDTSLYEANANRSMWHGIQLTRCNMRDMRIGDCVLDGAVLEDCDLRGANLSRIDDGLPLCTTKGTIFRRCDLRGAHLDGRRLDGTKFIDCQLAGHHGKPAIEGSYSVEGGDMSMAEIVKLWGPPR